MRLHKVFGQKSWRLASDRVEAFVTRLGGHLGPVTFSLPSGRIQPFALPPWAEERLGPEVPAILKVLRGDFFCCPFGGNVRPWRTERHPPHGETANRIWKLERERHENGLHSLHLSLRTHIRPGTVEKQILLRDGQRAVYCQHTLRGMSGPMTVGHHALLRFPGKPGSGLLSTSKFMFGKVCDHFESPERGGYSLFKPGAEFKTLDRVPTITHELVDLSRHPARRGYEELVLLVSDPTLPFAWTAVTFPERRYVWFALKDPAVLRFTLLWQSNGGRHYPPWNGRHIGVMGLEEVTSYFHYGLAESAGKNPLNQRGMTTCIRLSKTNPTTIRYIMALQPVPRGFNAVGEILLRPGRAVLRSCSGKEVIAPIDTDFLRGQS